MQAPLGIPTVTYCRIQPTSSLGHGDVVPDGNAVVVIEPGQPSTRYEMSHIVDRTVHDEEACETAFGSLAGGGMGAVLNPVAAFVNDSVNIVIVLTGSRQSRKGLFLKRTLLPFLSNEILSHLDVRNREFPPGQYRAQLSLSAFDIQDEVISDLLRPAARGLSIVTTLEDGVVVLGLHREKILDEATLRKLLSDGCDNRGVHMLPVGGSIDTSAAVFEFRLHQSEPSGANPMNMSAPPSRESSSRLLVVDIPATDPLASTQESQNISLLAGPQLFKSLTTFVEVSRKLGNPHRAQLAPFRASKLTSFLSEMLGGNALVVALGFVTSGEPNVTRTTLDILTSLSRAAHFPLAAREQSDVLRGLLAKYRALLRHAQDVVDDRDTDLSSRAHHESELRDQVAALQKELAAAAIERDKLSELSALMKQKHETVMEEKLQQSEILRKSEEDNVSLAQTIVQLQLAMTTQKEEADDEIHALNNTILEQRCLLEERAEQISTLERQKAEEEAEIRALQTSGGELQTQLADLEKRFRESEDALATQKQRGLDLSAELLSLVNQNEVLQRERDGAVEQQETLRRENEVFHEEQLTLQRENKSLLERVLDKDEELLALSKRLLSPELSAAQDVEREKAGKRAVQAMQRKVDEQRDLTQQRRMQQLENEVQRLKGDLQAATGNQERAEKEVARLLSIHREMVSKYLTSTPDDTTAGAGSRSGDQTEDASALDTLLGSYRSREQHLEGLLQRARVERAQAVDKYRGVKDQHVRLLQSLEDAQKMLQSAHLADQAKLERESPSSSTASLQMPKGKAATASSAVQQSMQQLHAQLALLLQTSVTEQYTFLANDVDLSPRAQASMTPADSSERLQDEESLAQHTAALVTTYQQRLKAAEKRAAQWQRENIALQVQIQELMNRLGEGPAQHQKQQAEQQLQQQLHQQHVMDEQKQQALSSDLTSLLGEVRELRRQLVESQQQKAQLEREVTTLRTPPVPTPPRTGEKSAGRKTKPVTPVEIPPLVNMPQPSSGADYQVVVIKDAPGSPAGPEALDDISTQGRLASALLPASQMPALKSGPVPALPTNLDYWRKQLATAEQRVAQLSMREMQLEEELKAYKAYMANVIPQYQRQINKMKHAGKSGDLKPVADQSTASNALTAATAADAALAAAAASSTPRLPPI